MATPTALPSSFTAGDVLTAANMNLLRGAFRVMQIVSTTKTDTFTSTSTTYTDITGLSATITPSSTSSKILVVANSNSSQTVDRILMMRLVRGTTAIGVGDLAGSRAQASSATSNAVADGANFGMNQVMTFLDSPATTSATTYKIQGAINAAGTWYVNRTTTDTDSALFPRFVSTITLYEVSA